MRKHFNYSFTCPEIDKNIKNFRVDLSNYLSTIIEELNPLFNATNESIKFFNTYEEAIYSSAELYFENVRDCNSIMRDEVEKVVEELVKERDEYKRLSEFWEDEAIEKNKQIEDLKEEIENLK